MITFIKIVKSECQEVSKKIIFFLIFSYKNSKTYGITLKKKIVNKLKISNLKSAIDRDSLIVILLCTLFYLRG